MTKKAAATIRAATVMIAMALAMHSVSAQERQALPMDGKPSLPQRIITKPSADLLEAANPGAAVVTADLPPMSIYYVYERRDGMVEVGSNSRGETLGWIEEEATVDWKQSIVVEFNNRANAERERSLFFGSKDALNAAITGEDFIARLAQTRADVVAGVPNQAEVVAIEPAQYIDIEQNFYLLPILSFEENFLPFGQIGNYLEIASLSADDSETLPPQADFRAGVVFVIDTTQSMQPYIDQVRRAVEHIQQTLASSEVGDNLRFGLVGFRQSVEDNPAIEYHVKQFLPLSADATAEAFVAEIAKVTAATHSTQGFNEDSIGGAFEAIQNMSWDGFDARYVILLTDAGPRAPQMGQNFAGDLGVDQIATLAEQKDIRLLAIHLKTPAAPADHPYAEAAYRSITMRDGQSSYLGIDGGQVDSFAPQIDAMARQLVANVAAVRTNQPIAPVDDSAGAALVARAGQAMELEYLGVTQGEQAPDFFRAWTLDMAAENPALRSLDVRLMLTRNQLSSMASSLRQIVDEGEAATSLFDPLEFFRRVQDLAARASNDTQQIGDSTPLGDMMGEYLQDLPYSSPILNLTAQDWVTMGSAQQRDLLLSLRSKLSLYERIHNNPDKWVKLHPDAQEGESVTTVPLYQLP